jgi:MYXO-CTERM domain-containing protein
MRAPAILLSLAVLVSSTGAQAVPGFLRLSLTGDGATEMTVSWNTPGAAPSEVRYGTSPGDHPNLVSGSSFTASGALGVIHEVTLDALEPSTTYYYIAGSDSDGFSSEFEFTTAPAPDGSCGRFIFGFLADNRPDPTLGGGEMYPEVLAELADRNPAFLMNGGDMVIDGDQIDQWIDFLGYTEDASPTLPYMPCIGNHDDGPGEGDEAIYNQIFALPRSEGEHGSDTEDYYYFTYGNAIFVSLSTETFKGGDTPFGNQAAWLDRILTENPRRWRIVFYHKPSYTHEAEFSISHEPNEENQNAAFVDVFDRHHVDVVITSHNHWYERYEPSACATGGRAGSDEPCSVGATNFANGTVYLVSGGAGAFTIPSFLCDPFLGDVDGRAVCTDPHHYILGTIDNETMTIEAYDTDSNRVMDTFTITKPAVECASIEPEDLGATEDTGTGEPDAGTPDPSEEVGPQPDTTESTPDAEDEEPDSAPVETADEGGGGIVDRGDGSTDSSGSASGAGSTPDDGCGCSTRGGSPNGFVLFAVLLFLARRRLHLV